MEEKPEEFVKPKRQEMIDMLDEMIKSIDGMPAHAKFGMVTNADLAAVMTLIWAILKEKE